MVCRANFFSGYQCLAVSEYPPTKALEDIEVISNRVVREENWNQFDNPARAIEKKQTFFCFIVSVDLTIEHMDGTGAEAD
jgi:hypothetical protein